MDDRGGGGGGSFVAVRRISQGIDRGNTCHSTSAEVVAGSAAWLGRGLSCVCAQRRESDARPSFDLTPAQEECLQRLQGRIDVAYDSSISEHQEALRALWHAAFPEEELHGLISEQWKEMGWQGKDPSTDFRGGGFISLENLLYFARYFPLVEQYSNIWHHSRVRRYLTSEDWSAPEANAKPWYGLLMLLRKYPEHFVINLRSKNRVTQEFVSLVSLVS